ncbi:MAG: hypothetical protein K2X39_10380 [Silvanigrellaceae bacterium]|nr:hypothetical protein [Silvanigrellaceae bacterium]
MNEAIVEIKKYGPRKSHYEWAEINAVWEKNPKPLKAFCTELGISYTSFAYWRGRLKKEMQSDKSAVFAIAKTKRPEALPSNGTPSPLKIHYPNGVVLSLYCELNRQTVSILQPLLEVSPCR